MIFDDLPKSIKGAIREHSGVDAEDDSQDEHLEKLSASQLFHKYCCWHGFIGWATQLEYALDHIREYKQGEVHVDRVSRNL